MSPSRPLSTPGLAAFAGLACLLAVAAGAPAATPGLLVTVGEVTHTFGPE